MWCTTGIFKKKCGVNGDSYEGASLTCEDGKAHRQEAPEDCLAARLSGCLAACLVPLESLFKICSTTGLPVSNVRYNSLCYIKCAVQVESLREMCCTTKLRESLHNMCGTTGILVKYAAQLESLHKMCGPTRKSLYESAIQLE